MDHSFWGYAAESREGGACLLVAVAHIRRIAAAGVRCVCVRTGCFVSNPEMRTPLCLAGRIVTNGMKAGTSRAVFARKRTMLRTRSEARTSVYQSKRRQGRPPGPLVNYLEKRRRCYCFTRPSKRGRRNALRAFEPPPPLRGGVCAMCISGHMRGRRSKSFMPKEREVICRDMNGGQLVLVRAELLREDLA